MTDNDIKALAVEFANAINGTKVQIYDNSGRLWVFKKEDIIDIRTKPNKNNIVYIVLLPETGAFIEGDSCGGFEVDSGNIICVTGSINKWKKMLDFDVKVINDEIN